MYHIQTLNNISKIGLNRFDNRRYQVVNADTMSDESNPDAIVLRSYKMHDMPIPKSLKAVARAGAGVNNIPLERMTGLGIPVFNAPGANANAVKELVLAGLLIAARNLVPAINYTAGLQGSDAELASQVEMGKKKFAGFELPNKTIGVIGLGAIGRLVANTCADLGMSVVGYDPQLTVDGAWQLSASVQRAEKIDQLVGQADFVSLHVPLVEATKHLVNAELLSRFKPSATLLNMARGGIVDDQAVCAALDKRGLNYYITDFPNAQTRQCERAIELPHLGASTGEAEDNCAVMVIDQLKEFLEQGNIVNSVNFPNVKLARGDAHRVTIAHANEPNMLGQISTIMAQSSLNIRDMINKSREQIAYTIVDIDTEISQSVLGQICDLDGVLCARLL